MHDLPGQVQRLPPDGTASRFSVMGRVPQEVAVGQSHSALKVLRVNVTD